MTRWPLRLAVASLALLLLAGGVGSGFVWGWRTRTHRIWPYEDLRDVREWYRLTFQRNSPFKDGQRYRSLQGVRPWKGERPPPLMATAELEELGYAEGTLPPLDERTGTVVLDRSRAMPGFNLIISGHRAAAELQDLDGTVLHTWAMPFERAFPDVTFPPGRKPRIYWRKVALLPEGELLAVHDHEGVLKLDRDGELLWRWRGRAHHDVTVTPEGDVWTFDRTIHRVPRVDPIDDIIEEYLVVLDGATGEERRRISLLEAFERSDYAPSLKNPPHWGDLFHANSVEVLDGTLAETIPAFRAGNALVSLRATDEIVVIDMDQERVVWSAKGPWHMQHEAGLTADGTLVLLDNQGAWPISRALEYDPITREVVWQWGGGSPPISTEASGSAHRLPNGNTLIALSNTGRGIEVTPEGGVVWEWYNPQRAGDADQFIATLFDVERIDPDRVRGWLEEAADLPGWTARTDAEAAPDAPAADGG